MKRCVVFALLIACILTLAACETTSGRDATSAYYPFSRFLDQENFVPELGQAAFKEQIGKYRYQGRNLDSEGGYFFDGASGGGYRVVNDIFRLQNNYTVTDDGAFAEYTNTFAASVPLTGLSMPYNIRFNDTLSAVCKKIGIRFDPSTDFVSDNGNEGVMTLYKDGGVTLEVHKLSDKYRLAYSETYDSTRSDGRAVTVTRSVFMNFSETDLQLSLFGAYVTEKYPVD